VADVAVPADWANIAYDAVAGTFKANEAVVA
jgi:hypothetical protein